MEQQFATGLDPVGQLVVAILKFLVHEVRRRNLTHSGRSFEPGPEGRNEIKAVVRVLRCDEHVGV